MILIFTRNLILEGKCKILKQVQNDRNGKREISPEACAEFSSVVEMTSFL